VKETIRRKMLETKRRLILEEVSKIFEEEGFAQTRMQEIARRLDMSVGALYKLFDSKEALYYAYIDFQIRQFHETLLSRCPSLEDPLLCLRRFVRLKFDVFRSKRKAIEDPVVGDPLFFLKMNTRQRDPARPVFEYLAEIFETLGRTVPLREADRMKIAYLFNSFTTGYIEYWLHFDGDLRESEEEILTEFLEGMKA
jgi:AcrR family transcriptional regulator